MRRRQHKDVASLTAMPPLVGDVSEFRADSLLTDDDQ